MSYYEPQGWQAPAARQVSWEQPVPPSRSGSSSISQREDTPAFSSQFDEVDRAVDNLVKSGKLWTAPRRDSMPLMMGRPYADYDTRIASAMASRHHSISEFDGARPHPNNQGFYTPQRFQGRPNEVEQMMQAKRRMAAQRERELRNYHQEQQYNRSLLSEMSGNNKPERSLSPAAMSEESRRDLLARQHRALYGNDSPAFFAAGSYADDASRPDSQGGTGTPSSATGVRGPSPRGVDPFGLSHAHTPGPASTDGVVHTPTAASALQSPTRANSTSSPSSGINPVFGNPADQPVTSTSSPGGADSPSRTATSKPTAGPIGSVGPIGSRPIPTTSSVPNPGLTKRSTTPLPSPLGFSFTAGDTVHDHSVSSTGIPPTSATGAPVGWGNGGGVWGSKSGLGVQAPVWG
jgi:hypothetical protein